VALADTLDLSFDKSNLLLVTVRTTGTVTTPDENIRLLQRLLERARTVPGVTAASFARSAPGPAQPTIVRSTADGLPIRVDSNQVGDDYLRVLKLAPAMGEPVDGTVARGRTVVAINENLAARLWPDTSPLGQRLLLGDERAPLEVVGVVPNGILGTFSTERRPGFILVPATQQPAAPAETTFLLRHTGDLAAVTRGVRTAFHDVEDRVPIVNVRTMQEQLRTLTATTLLIQLVLSVFAGVCLLVASIGLYAVVAFSVERRSREFAVRMALGATPRQMVRMVVGEGVRLGVVGVVLGLIISAVAGQAFRALMLGVTPTDVPTYVGVVLVVGALTLAAAYLPARRVLRAAPLRSLQHN
jgi:putative ABC transport system permease protein